jgi:hypothetical protein
MRAESRCNANFNEANNFIGPVSRYRSLARRGVKVSIGPLRDKPQDVACYVVYTDHWNWDLAMYLDSLDVQFFDNSTGQMIASGSFRNSQVMESFPNPRKKTFEVVDSIYNSK